MSRSTTPRNHPFPFLLYLEWVLIVIALLSELMPAPFPRLARGISLSRLFAILGFGAMGLRLPVGRPYAAILYTVLEFALVFISTPTTGRRIFVFPFLYVVLVIRSCLLFKLPGRLLATIAAFMMFLSITSHRLNTLDLQAPPFVRERLKPVIFGFGFNSIMLFGLALLFVLLTVNALLAERESRDKLTIANDQLRDYALRAERLAMEQERNRIARDIHDSLGHSLTALNLQIESALKLWDTNPRQAYTFLQQAKRLGSTSLSDVRQSVATMRSDPWQSRSLDEAIATLLQDFEQHTRIHPSCEMQLHQNLAPEINTSLYRIIQEALTNIYKHANATRVQIGLHCTSTALYLTIQDDGKGFDVEQNQTGFGLRGMRERTLALNGSFEVHSSVGQGCRISITIPLLNRDRDRA
ncbi:sensor histidine kinase [Leptolyngbya sp. AN02str]|uniref:sensor histidine kinase n=1 Tax=Leptolyngbya sp. AN02str TaxID=3423363 RepID=UPI003D31D37D